MIEVEYLKNILTTAVLSPMAPKKKQQMPVRMKMTQTMKMSFGRFLGHTVRARCLTWRLPKDKQCC